MLMSQKIFLTFITKIRKMKSYVSFMNDENIRVFETAGGSKKYRTSSPISVKVNTNKK